MSTGVAVRPRQTRTLSSGRVMGRRVGGGRGCAGHSGIRSVGPCYSAAGDDLNKGGGSGEFLIFSLIRASLDLWEEGVKGRAGRQILWMWG